jgi:hypothetical protein
MDMAGKTEKAYLIISNRKRSSYEHLLNSSRGKCQDKEENFFIGQRDKISG